MATTEIVYGFIFTLYIACFIFIGGYMLVRRRRKENQMVSENQKNQDQNVVNEKKKPKENHQINDEIDNKNDLQTEEDKKNL
jgi:predicted membrane protein